MATSPFSTVMVHGSFIWLSWSILYCILAMIRTLTTTIGFEYNEYNSTTVLFKSSLYWLTPYPILILRRLTHYSSVMDNSNSLAEWDLVIAWRKRVFSHSRHALSHEIGWNVRLKRLGLRANLGPWGRVGMILWLLYVLRIRGWNSWRSDLLCGHLARHGYAGYGYGCNMAVGCVHLRMGILRIHYAFLDVDEWQFPVKTYSREWRMQRSQQYHSFKGMKGTTVSTVNG